jgi:hypothetical protein
MGTSINYQKTMVDRMKTIFKKQIFNIGDLIVDTENVKSGLIVELLIRHVKIMWDGATIKISKWELNNKLLNKKYKHLPRARRNKHIG